MSITSVDIARRQHDQQVWLRGLLISIIAFLTLIDLFGSQALLPILIETYQTTPAKMSTAVNACTFGMAIAGLTIAIWGRELDRKFWIWMSLVLLSVPTALLAIVDNLELFAALRVLQGVFMATAFTMTMTYLSERCSITAASGALAAYIAGNVASNLLGRYGAVTLATHYGTEASFIGFALLNLAGALISLLYIGRLSGPIVPELQQLLPTSVLKQLASRKLVCCFAMGFLILFVFIGCFTYVNFELVGPNFDIPISQLGLLYLVFLPSMFTTPVAGRLALRLGSKTAFWVGMTTAILGLLLMLSMSLPSFLSGLMLTGCGLFFAQAVATSFVGRAAPDNQIAANGVYLSSYYLGGVVGSICVGIIYQLAGWTMVVITLTVVLCITAILGFQLTGDSSQPPKTRYSVKGVNA